MIIEFFGPVYPIDRYALRAFIEIIDIGIMSNHIVEFNRRLNSRNVNEEYKSLSGYFKWAFLDDRFVLWQRVAYNSTVLFEDKVLQFSFYSLFSNSHQPDLKA